MDAVTNGNSSHRQTEPPDGHSAAGEASSPPQTLHHHKIHTTKNMPRRKNPFKAIVVSKNQNIRGREPKNNQFRPFPVAAISCRKSLLGCLQQMDCRYFRISRWSLKSKIPNVMIINPGALQVDRPAPAASRRPPRPHPNRSRANYPHISCDCHLR